MLGNIELFKFTNQIQMYMSIGNSITKVSLPVVVANLRCPLDDSRWLLVLQNVDFVVENKIIYYLKQKRMKKRDIAVTHIRLSRFSYPSNYLRNGK